MKAICLPRRTCERSVVDQKSPAPLSRKRTMYLSPNRPTWKMKMKMRRMKRKMRETVQSAKWRLEENQNNHCARSMDDVMRTNILSQCHVRHCYECRETRENVTCEGVLFTETDLFGCFLFLQTDLLLGSRSSG